MIPNLGLGGHLEQWLQISVLATISNSPSDSIRQCTTLGISHYPLAMNIFSPDFLSCWNKMMEKGSQQIANSFCELINAQGSCETVTRKIINLLVFMHKIEQPPAFPPAEFVETCLRYESIALALQPQESIVEKCLRATFLKFAT
jgi:hypothetical protein